MADNRFTIRQSDVSIDHMIDNRMFEPQRTAHSFIYIEGLEGLVDIHGYEVKTSVNDTDGSGINYTPDNLLRIALSSHGMPNNSGELIKIRKGNEEIKFAGGVSFDDIDIAVTDWIGVDMENLISAWDGLRYNPVKGFINPASVYKKRGTIVQYSPDGNILRTWTLLGAWIDAVKYGEYDRSDASGVREISFTLHIDKAYPDVRQSFVQ